MPISTWSPLSPSPTISIEFDDGDDDLFFLYPVPESMEPIADTIVAGRVLLDLPVDRRVSGISVQLVRTESTGAR